MVHDLSESELLADGGRRRFPLAMRRGRGRAFTLIEMLIVIAILALLLAILLPAFWQAREHAWNAQCQANLSHLAKALRVSSDVPGEINFPGPGGWISYIEGQGSRGLLRCPKGGSETGGRPVGTTGNVEHMDSLPPSLRFNDFESNSRINLFTERVGLTLESSVHVNISEPGYYTNNYNSTGKNIPAGTTVDTFMITFDPVGSQGTQSSGSVTFGADIIGLICLTGDLNSTDKSMGAEGVIYPTGQSGARGFESGQELVRIEQDRRTLTIEKFWSSYPGENVRILTLPGGSASYGMNGWIGNRAPEANQVMLVEYELGIVRPESKSHGEYIQPRHFGRVNVVYPGGGVQSLLPEALAAEKAIWGEKKDD